MALASAALAFFSRALQASRSRRRFCRILRSFCGGRAGQLLGTGSAPAAPGRDKPSAKVPHQRALGLPAGDPGSPRLRGAHRAAGVRALPQAHQLAALPVLQGARGTARAGTALIFEGGLWSPPCCRGREGAAPGLSPPLPSCPAYSDGSPVPLQEVAQRSEEGDGGRVDEVSFSCTQAPLSLSNFDQGLPCNERASSCTVQHSAGCSQRAQSQQGGKGAGHPAPGTTTMPMPAAVPAAAGQL